MPAPYFSNFPYITYTLNNSPQPGEIEWVQDIFRRSAPLINQIKNKRLYYTYQIADGDTPEMIAHKYYGSTSYHWVVTLINGIIDPLLDWPKNYGNLIAYIADKYGSVAVAQANTHHYTMTQTKTDSLGNTSESTMIIDQVKYDTLSSPVPEVYTFGDGATVTVTTSRAIVDGYTYEQELNETKRTIILLKKEHLGQIVAELEKLLVI
jgi:hypothetical protein